MITMVRKAWSFPPVPLPISIASSVPEVLMWDHDERRSSVPDLVLRTPPNWTAVGFFSALGILHLSIALPAFLDGRWEGYLSLILAGAFVTAGTISARFRFELAILPDGKQLRLRHGTRRFHFERTVPFAAVHGVRVTLPVGQAAATIQLLCPHDDITCPPTAIPRQQALFLAMMLEVPLIKVSDRDSPHEAPIEAAAALSPDRQA